MKSHAVLAQEAGFQTPLAAASLAYSVKSRGGRPSARVTPAGELRAELDRL